MAETPASETIPLAKSDQNLVWLDCEMTGLDPERDRIIEIALLVTDPQLNILAESPAWVLHQPDEVLEAMDSWNRGTHAKTGLIGRVRASSLNEAQAEAMALEFLAPLVPANASPMCGNSICQDRRFLARGMPRLERYFHYRNLDVSTIKELSRRWSPAILGGLRKQAAHTALSDVRDSIAELAYYRKHMGPLAGLPTG